MNCPICHTEMRAGTVSLQGVVTADRAVHDLAVPGRLAFLPTGQRERLVPKLKDDALLCDHCDTMIILGAFNALACFECGENIPGEASACPACGWSW
jgi:hypothetical protein